MTGSACRVGVDIGGTFTDIVALTGGGRAAVAKVASTPDDYGRGVLHGLAEALAELGLPAAGVAEIVHGFTVATNAIREGTGPEAASTSAPAPPSSWYASPRSYRFRKIHCVHRQYSASDVASSRDQS